MNLFRPLTRGVASTGAIFDAVTVSPEEIARLRSELGDLNARLTQMRAENRLFTDYLPLQGQIIDKTAELNRALALPMRVSPSSVPAPVDPVIGEWQTALANYGRLQPFKPSNPFNPEPLVTGVLDVGTVAATQVFENQFGLPVTGQPKREYIAILTQSPAGPIVSSEIGTSSSENGVTPSSGLTPSQKKMVIAGLLVGIVAGGSIYWFMRTGSQRSTQARR